MKRKLTSCTETTVKWYVIVNMEKVTYLSERPDLPVREDSGLVEVAEPLLDVFYVAAFHDAH